MILEFPERFSLCNGLARSILVYEIPKSQVMPDKSFNVPCQGFRVFVDKYGIQLEGMMGTLNIGGLDHGR